MLTKKFVVVLAGLMLLAFVVSASADREKAHEKGVRAILENLVTELRHIRIDLENIRTELQIIRAPDLVPNPYHHHLGPEGPADFCRILESGKLWVSVHNQGAGKAAPSVTEVYFRVPPHVPVQKSCGAGCAQVDVATPGMDPFRGVERAVEIPAGCFGSVFGPDDINNCQFKINVDSPNSLNESNEVNNRAFGACQGLL